VSTRTVPRAKPSIGMALAASPARIAPNTIETPARGRPGGPAAQARRDDAAQRMHEAAVRCGPGVWPPGRAGDLDLVGRRGERAGADGRRARPALRRTVQGVRSRPGVLSPPAAITSGAPDGTAPRPVGTRRRTRPEARRGGQLGQARPVPSKNGGVHVVSACVHAFSTVDGRHSWCPAAAAASRSARNRR